MNDEKLLILNLSQVVFEDEDYKRIQYLLENDKINALRLFVDEKLELLSAVQCLNEQNEALSLQIQKLNELEDVVLDYFLATI